MLESNGRSVDVRAWDGRREQVLADHPTIDVDGYGSCALLWDPKAGGRGGGENRIILLFEECDLPSSSMVKNCDMRGASTINCGSRPHIYVFGSWKQVCRNN